MSCVFGGTEESMYFRQFISALGSCFWDLFVLCRKASQFFPGLEVV